MGFLIYAVVFFDLQRETYKKEKKLRALKRKILLKCKISY